MGTVGASRGVDITLLQASLLALNTYSLTAFHFEYLLQSLADSFARGFHRSTIQMLLPAGMHYAARLIDSRASSGHADALMTSSLSTSDWAI